MSAACPPAKIVHASASTAALTTRQLNVLRLLLGQREFSAEQVAELDCQVLLRTPGIGSKSVDIIRAWLQAQGRDLRNSPSMTKEARRQARVQQRLERAAALLRKHGYAVQAPAGEG